MNVVLPISVFALIVNLVEGQINCYTCDSRKHPSCGKTFEYSEKQAQINGLVTRCQDQQLCRKTEVNEFKKKFVVRECVDSSLLGCRALRKGESNVCDCSDSLCNGKDNVKAFLGLIIAFLTLQFILIF